MQQHERRHLARGGGALGARETIAVPAHQRARERRQRLRILRAQLRRRRGRKVRPVGSERLLPHPFLLRPSRGVRVGRRRARDDVERHGALDALTGLRRARLGEGREGLDERRRARRQTGVDRERTRERAKQRDVFPILGVFRGGGDDVRDRLGKRTGESREPFAERRRRDVPRVALRLGPARAGEARARLLRHRRRRLLRELRAGQRAQQVVQSRARLPLLGSAFGIVDVGSSGVENRATRLLLRGRVHDRRQAPHRLLAPPRVRVLHLREDGLDEGGGVRGEVQRRRLEESSGRRQRRLRRSAKLPRRAGKHLLGHLLVRQRVHQRPQRGGELGRMLRLGVAGEDDAKVGVHRRRASGARRLDGGGGGGGAEDLPREAARRQRRDGGHGLGVRAEEGEVRGDELGLAPEEGLERAAGSRAGASGVRLRLGRRRRRRGDEAALGLGEGGEGGGVLDDVQVLDDEARPAGEDVAAEAGEGRGLVPGLHEQAGEGLEKVGGGGERDRHGALHRAAAGLVRVVAQGGEDDAAQILRRRRVFQAWTRSVGTAGGGSARGRGGDLERHDDGTTADVRRGCADRARDRAPRVSARTVILHAVAYAAPAQSPLGERPAGRARPRFFHRCAARI